MINEAKKKTINDIFAEGTLIDSALKMAGEKALLQHKKLGNPVALWHEGKVVWIPPEEIPLPENTPNYRRVGILPARDLIFSRCLLWRDGKGAIVILFLANKRSLYH
jgi:hypothetical protein